MFFETRTIPTGSDGGWQHAGHIRRCGQQQLPLVGEEFIMTVALKETAARKRLYTSYI